MPFLVMSMTAHPTPSMTLHQLPGIANEPNKTADYHQPSFLITIDDHQISIIMHSPSAIKLLRSETFFQ